ncbi:MAG: guanylate kinase [Chloroflexi bacterium]|nr:guanylate kinase [Chloroflexota bacterium]
MLDTAEVDAREIERLYPPHRGLLIVLSGPSGVGKDALIAELKRERWPCHFAITTTTRPRRANETDGIHYHFVTPERFASMREGGELLEWAVVHGREYGTPVLRVREALAAGRDVLLKIDVQGADQVRRRVPGALLIFLAPVSMAELIDRLRRRGTESGAELERRIATACDEMRRLPGYDYIVVNREGGLADAVATFKAIVVAEHARVQPRDAKV